MEGLVEVDFGEGKGSDAGRRAGAFTGAGAEEIEGEWGGGKRGGAGLKFQGVGTDGDEVGVGRRGEVLTVGEDAGGGGEIGGLGGPLAIGVDRETPGEGRVGVGRRKGIGGGEDEEGVGEIGEKAIGVEFALGERFGERGGGGFSVVARGRQREDIAGVEGGAGEGVVGEDGFGKLVVGERVEKAGEGKSGAGEAGGQFLFAEGDGLF